MATSIPDAHWHTDAGDPYALTRLPALPYLRVTRAEYVKDKQRRVAVLREFTAHVWRCARPGRLHARKEQFHTRFATASNCDDAARQLQTRIAQVQGSGLTNLQKFVSLLQTL